jgi:hypothetical protein
MAAVCKRTRSTSVVPKSPAGQIGEIDVDRRHFVSLQGKDAARPYAMADSTAFVSKS